MNSFELEMSIKQFFKLKLLSVKIKEYEDGTEYLLLQKEKLDE